MSEPERVARVKVQREPNYLYYVKSDNEGWLCIYKTALKRGGKKKEEKITEKKEELL